MVLVLGSIWYGMREERKVGGVWMHIAFFFCFGCSVSLFLHLGWRCGAFTLEKNVVVGTGGIFLRLLTYLNIIICRPNV